MRREVLRFSLTPWHEDGALASDRRLASSSSPSFDVNRRHDPSFFEIFQGTNAFVEFVARFSALLRGSNTYEHASPFTTISLIGPRREAIDRVLATP